MVSPAPVIGTNPHGTGSGRRCPSVTETDSSAVLARWHSQMNAGVQEAGRPEWRGGQMRCGPRSGSPHGPARTAFLHPLYRPGRAAPRCARTRAGPLSRRGAQGSRRGKRRGALPQPCGPQGCAGHAGVKTPAVFLHPSLSTKSLGVIYPCVPCGPLQTALECGFEPQGCTPAAPLRTPANERQRASFAAHGQHLAPGVGRGRPRPAGVHLCGTPAVATARPSTVTCNRPVACALYLVAGDE